MQTECSQSTGPTLFDAETCESVERTTSRPLTSSAGGSRARTLALQGNERGLRASAQPSGASSPESLASLSPDGCWLKTCQGCCQVMMDGSLATYSGTWPRAGTMRSGTVYQQPPLVPLTDVIGSLLWPTLNCMDSLPPRDPVALREWNNSRDGRKNRRVLSNLREAIHDPLYQGMWPTPRAEERQQRNSQDNYVALSMAVKMWPTPMSQNWRSGKTLKDYGNSRPLQEAVSGQLNPTWVEWLMGFPLGWTDCDVLETP